MISIWPRSNYVHGIHCVSSEHCRADRLKDFGAVEKRLLELVELEEDHIVVGFHQHVYKSRENAWYEIHIK